VRSAWRGWRCLGRCFETRHVPTAMFDLLVPFAPGRKSFERLLALSELLEARLGRRVELVTTEALSPFIGPRILAEAQDVLRAA